MKTFIGVQCVGRSMTYNGLMILLLNNMKTIEKTVIYLRRKSKGKT